MSDQEYLYRILEQDIYRRIFSGQYGHNDFLPPERELAETYALSRVTVRKTLKLLEGRNIVSRTQGKGTRITLHPAGHRGTMDIIAVVAPAQNRFFSQFIYWFSMYAESQDSLVVFKQKAAHEPIETSLFKLLLKRVTNAVVWPEDSVMDTVLIGRLRGLGMNMVLFDKKLPGPYADSVLLDNSRAMEELYMALKKRGKKRIGYIGWDIQRMDSAAERQRAFLELAGSTGRVYSLPWALHAQDEEIVQHLSRIDYSQSDALICSDGVLGNAAALCIRSGLLEGLDVFSLDDVPESREHAMVTYPQPLEAMASQVFRCLEQQNLQPESWKAAVHHMRGSLHDPRDKET